MAGSGYTFTTATCATTASFAAIQISGQSSVLADSTLDTLTFTSVGPLLLTTNASTDTVSFSAAPHIAKIHTGTSGYLPYYTAGTEVSKSTGLYWDSSNSKMGVQTTAPSAHLTVSGHISARGDVICETLYVADQSIRFKNGARFLTTSAGNIVLMPAPNNGNQGTAIVITSGGKIVATPVSAINNYISATTESLQSGNSTFTGFVSSNVVFSSGGNSGQWEVGYIDSQLNKTDITWVAASSGSWDHTYATVKANSGAWSSGGTYAFKTVTLSGKNIAAAIGPDIAAESTTDTLTLCAGPNIALISDSATDTITISSVGGDGGGGGGAANEYSFKTISVAGQPDIVADTTTDTLSVMAGSNVTITSRATDTIVFAATDTNTTYTAGSGLELYGTQFSHENTSAQSSSDNSGRTYIQDITLDTYGHVTGLATATESTGEANEHSFKTITLSGQNKAAAIGPDVVADTTTDTFTLCAGPNIALISDPATDTITISSVGGDGGGGGGMSNWILEDGDGTEVTVADAKEVKFVEGNAGIDINWTDVSDGSDSDPYDLTFNIPFYSTVQSESGYWDQTVTTVRGNSAGWEKGEPAHSTLQANSGYWDQTLTTVRANSGDWSPSTGDTTTSGTLSARDRLIAGTGASLSGNVTIGGDLEILGDDIVMGTNTVGHILMGGGANFGPVAQTSITSVGTISAGAWQGTSVALGYGGTGLVGATDGKIVIADGSGAPVHLDVGSSTAITILGTVATGTWQGTAVADAYVAGSALWNWVASNSATKYEDTTVFGTLSARDRIIASVGASLSGDVTVGNDLIVGGNNLTINGVLYQFPGDNGDAGQQLQTNGSGVLSWEAAGSGGGSGDITDVIAGAGLTGGATSGSATLNVSGGALIDVTGNEVDVDLTEATEAAIANGDYIIFLDGGATGTHAKEAVADLATLFAGAGITATNSVIAVDAAQTGITSLLAADIKIGEDDQTKIDFETADEIHFYANNVHQVKLIDNAFTPVADSDVDLGTSSLYWKDAYIDTVKTTGNIVAAGTVSASDPGGSAYGSSPHWTYVADNSGTNVPMTFVNRVGSGTATADTDGASATYNAAKAFDGNDGTFFEPANDAAQFPNWLKYDFGSGNAYTITAVTFRIDGGHDNYVDRAPKDWFAQGSNNDSDWVSLGTFPNTVFERVDAGQQNYVYLVTNDTAYRYIRITIDNVQNSGGLLRITEIKLSEMVAKGYAGNFVLEDDSGDEVTIEHNNEVKFIGSGITTNWTDTTPGTDGDPYDLTFTVDAAQTGITSLLATDIKIGEDDQTKVDFETANEIHLYADNANRATINSSGASIVGTLSAKDRLIASTGASLSGNVTIGGDLEVLGDDLKMGTNTNAYLLVADGTNFNPVAMSGDAAITNAGVLSIAVNSIDGTHIALGSDAEGDVMYYNGTNYVRLAKGTDDHVLTMNGNVPNWEAASGGGGSSEWTDTGSVLHPTDSSGTADAVVIGGTTAGNSDIAFNTDGSAVFNEQSASVDFRVESNGNANMLFVDGSADAVGIGTSLPEAELSVAGEISARDGFSSSVKVHTDLTSNGVVTYNITGPALQTIVLKANQSNTYLGSETLPVGKTVTIRLSACGANRTLAWHGSMNFVGEKPASIASGKQALLSITTFGTVCATAGKSDVTCAYAVED